MSIRKMLLTVAAAATATIAWAKPVLWFHFDEAVPGTLAPSPGTVVNAANPGTLDGTIRGVAGAALKDTQYVSYTNTLNGMSTWLDPATGAKGDDATGVFIHNKSPDGSSAGGLVTVPNDTRLHLTTFTTEFFFRVKPDTVFTNQSLIVQMFNSPSNTFAWSARISKDCGTVLLYCHPIGEKAKTMSCDLPTPCSDYRWHHLAFSHDGTTMKVYYDYACINTLDIPVAYSDQESSILAIAADPRVGWGRFLGFIDEFRISDEVLTPDQFLRPINLLCDADTIIYVSGNQAAQADASDFSGYGVKSDSLNEIWNGLKVEPRVIYNAKNGKLPESQNVTPNETVGTGIFDVTNLVSDTASLFFETNAAATLVGKTGRLMVNDVSSGKTPHTILTNDETTIEFFVKPSLQAADCNTRKYLMSCHTVLGDQLVYIRSADDKFAISLCDTNGTTQIFNSPTTARDGNWHHLALVQDRPAREVCFYVDHVLQSVFTNFVMDASYYSGSDKYRYFDFCAAYADSDNTSYRGWMDELRVTRRALQPSEFLSAYGLPQLPKVAGKQVLFYAPLDGDLRAYPFTNALVGAVNAGTVSFDAANRPLETIEARAAMELATGNEAALTAVDGKVTYDNTMTLAGVKSMTIEFYANVPDGINNLPLVRLEDDSKSCFQVAKSPSGQLEVMVFTDQTVKGRYIYFDTSKLRRRHWHHYAVTLERKEEAGEVFTEVHAWVDHVELDLAPGQATRTEPGEIPSRLVNAKLYLGRARTWASLTGALDEVRITEGVLGVDDFLDRCPPLGFMFLVR